MRITFLFLLFISGCSSPPFFPLPSVLEDSGCSEPGSAFADVGNRDSFNRLLRGFRLIASFPISCAFAGQPLPEGFKCPNKRKHGTLKLTWDVEAQPQAVGWLNSSSCLKVSGRAKSIKIRKISSWGQGGDPTQLLVIPRDNSLLPKILKISKDQREAHFSTEKIPPYQIAFWSNLGESSCDQGCSSSFPHELWFRVSSGSHFRVFRGFDLKILIGQLLESIYLMEPVSSYSPDISDFSIQGFQAPNNLAKSMCLEKGIKQCEQCVKSGFKNCSSHRFPGEFHASANQGKRLQACSLIAEKKCKSGLIPTKESYGKSFKVKVKFPKLSIHSAQYLLYCPL